MRLSSFTQAIILAATLAASASFGAAQTKFDSYDHLPADDEAVRLNAFSEALRHQPTLRGYLVGYAEARIPEGVLLRRLYGDQRYLTESLGVERGRVVVVNGGYRQTFTLELWLVPNNAAPPLTPTSEVDTSKRYLFDEVCCGCEDVVNLDLYGLGEGLKFFASVLQEAPNTRGSIVIRPGSSLRTRAALREARQARLLLVREYKIASRRVKIRLAPRLKGHVTIAEMWVLPAASNQ